MNPVFFDFDGTLTKLDTTLAFAGQLVRHGARHRLRLLALAIAMARAHVLSNTALKRVFARLFLQGLEAAQVSAQAREFDFGPLDSYIDPMVLSILRDHVGRGDAVYLVTANFDCLLEPLIPRWSLTGIVGTRVEWTEGRCTGGLIGAACHGQEKLRRTIDRLGPAAVEGATAYGNPDDSSLLAAVRTAFLVRRRSPILPNARLRRSQGCGSGYQGPRCVWAATIVPYATSRNRKAAASAP